MPKLPSRLAFNFEHHFIPLGTIAMLRLHFRHSADAIIQ